MQNIYISIRDRFWKQNSQGFYCFLNNFREMYVKLRNFVIYALNFVTNISNTVVDIVLSNKIGSNEHI